MDAPAFFAAALEAFERAARRSGIVERACRPAGEEARLLFAGPSLVGRVTRAIAHLLAPSSVRPSLTVRLWDRASTGVAMPPPPWGREAYGARSEVTGFCDERFRTVYSLGDGTLTLFDAARGEAVFWVPDAGAFPLSEAALPLRAVFHHWLLPRGLVLAHAAAVGVAGGAALVAGRSGAGKSTIALACAGTDVAYLADDHCLVDRAGPAVHCLYSSGRFAPADAPRFARLAALPEPDCAPGEKTLRFIDDLGASALARSLPLRALLVPERRGAPAPAFERVPGGAALRALAPSTLFQMPSAGEKELAAFAALARSVPAYRFDPGPKLDAVPGALARFLEGRR